MKCSACQVSVAGDVRTHYTSELHRINTKRQIYDAPPITEEELSIEGFSDDVSLEINGMCREEDLEKARSKYRDRMPKRVGVADEKCVLCDGDGGRDHYREHGLSNEDIGLVQNRVCYVCYEGFATAKDLQCHIASGNHRRVFVDGLNLILESGKIIRGNARTTEARTGIVRRPRKEEGRLEAVKCVTAAERRINPEKKNQLKISMGMNSQMHFRIDWMQ
jgi:hypothetical protein